MSAAVTRTEHLHSRITAADRYRRIRSVTTRMCTPLSAEDMAVQACTHTSPTKWHLAHTTWFFETFILERFEEGFTPYDRAFRVLFNSYYQQVGDRHPRPQRGMLTRPGLGEVWAYRDTTDERVASLLRRASSAQLGRILPLLELGLNHEQQHQELMLMDIQRLLAAHPLQPAYAVEGHAGTGNTDRIAPPPGWIAIEGGLCEIGHGGDEFAYDNEGPRHRVYLEPFELGSRLVTNAEFIEFIEAGGYRDASHWLDEGWALVCEQHLEHPMYWRKNDGGRWTSFSLHGRRPLDPHAPAVHISFFEADAYAKWRGARLPTEAEWELAAAPRWSEAVKRGNFLDTGSLAPCAAGDRDDGQDIAQLAGDAWEWTRSAHEPYPGYAPPKGAIGEYNGKFMCGSFVLRGGCCITPRDHIRPTYRNFFSPQSSWAFSGIRLARDVSNRGSTKRSNAEHGQQLPNLRPTIRGAAEHETLGDDARTGLGSERRPRSVPPKHLYDAAGGKLFEKIVQLDEYYLASVESRLLDRLLPDLSQRRGKCVTLIEPGAGDGSKARRVLSGLDSPRMFVPIEVNAEALGRCARGVAAAFPELCVQPIRAGFDEGLESLYGVPKSNRLVFFPGSSIGNLELNDRVALLRAFAEAIGDDGRCLVSFDLVKDAQTLRAAYDDREGVSRAFALNLIHRLNRELDAGLDPDAFEYEAIWDEQERRIEMRLLNARPQKMRIGDAAIELAAGERIVTEYSHKFTHEMIESEAEAAGLGTLMRWTDPDDAYAVYLFRSGTKH